MGHHAIIGLGSSLDDGARVIERALARIAAVPRVSLKGASDVARTAAFGGRTVAPFANAACVVETTLSPPGLLAALHAIERAMGRVRVTKNAPRAIDLDLLLVVEQPVPLAATRTGLALPHPGLVSRASALFPARQAWARAGLARALPAALARPRPTRAGIIDVDAWGAVVAPPR